MVGHLRENGKERKGCLLQGLLGVCIILCI